MPKKTNPITRRTFLKGTAAVSALSIGGISSLALASKTPAADTTAIGGADLSVPTGVFYGN